MGIIYNTPKIITDGLVLCLDGKNKRSYPGTGTAWNDISEGFSNSLVSRKPAENATLVNGATFNSDGYIVFDGTNDYASVGTNLDAQFTNEEVTVCAFAQIGADVSKNSLIAFFGSTGNNTFSWHAFFLPCYRLSGSAGNGVEQLFWNNTSGWEQGNANTTDFDQDTWYFFSWTISGRTLKFYVNDGYDGSATLANSTNGKFNPRNNRVWIGRAASSGEYINGVIGNLLVYNRALEHQEIIDNFNATRKRYGV